MKRTALVTAASIAAVVITGTAAVGANIGILSSADDSPVGDLGATTEVAVAPVEVVVEVPTAAPSPGSDDTAASTPPPTVVSTGENPPGMDVRTEAFRVDRAGIVFVVAEGRTVRVASVEPAAGWSWTPDDDVPDDSLDVRLSSASEVLVLHVEVRPDGTLDARIDLPQPSAASSGPAVTPSHDDDEYDEYDDDDDEYDEYDDDEYDEYDDHDDEYEGRDDDD